MDKKEREANERKTLSVEMAATSLDCESNRDTVVNISENQLAVQEDLMEDYYGIPSTMDQMLDRAPPPSYQEHNDFYPPSAPIHPVPPFLPSTQLFPSSLQSQCSPPPSYSQIDLSDNHRPSATSYLPSQLGGPSSHIPSQLGPLGATSQFGGARPKKLQQTNQQVTNNQDTSRQAGATNGQRIGYDWLHMVTNGQRILNVRQEREEEKSVKGKVAEPIRIFIFIIVFIYLIRDFFTKQMSDKQAE